MTVGKLKELLEDVDDSFKVIVGGDVDFADADNEVFTVGNVYTDDTETEALPVLQLLRRRDFDFREWIESRFSMFEEDWIDDAEAAEYLKGFGVTVEDIELNYPGKARWARNHLK